MRTLQDTLMDIADMGTIMDKDKATDAAVKLATYVPSMFVAMNELVPYVEDVDPTSLGYKVTRAVIGEERHDRVVQQQTTRVENIRDSYETANEVATLLMDPDSVEYKVAQCTGKVAGAALKLTGKLLTPLAIAQAGILSKIPEPEGVKGALDKYNALQAKKNY